MPSGWALWRLRQDRPRCQLWQSHAAVVSTYTNETYVSPNSNIISFAGSPAFTENYGLSANGTNVSEDNVVYGSIQVVTKLASGVSVGPTAFADAQPGGAFGPSQTPAPFYIGLEVINAGVDNFGYAELTYTSSIALIGYAFQTTPNTAIVTADLTPAVGGTPVPEPASIALLAAGLAGIMAIRRRSTIH